MLAKDDNASNNFWPDEDKKSVLKQQNIEKHYRDLVSKNSDTGCCIKNMLLEYTPKDVLLKSDFEKSLGFVNRSCPLIYLYSISNIII